MKSSALKHIRNLDYAVYGNLIVPFLMFDAEVMFQIHDDHDYGKCRIVSKPRKRNYK